MILNLKLRVQITCTILRVRVEFLRRRILGVVRFESSVNRDAVFESFFLRVFRNRFRTKQLKSNFDDILQQSYTVVSRVDNKRE